VDARKAIVFVFLASTILSSIIVAYNLYIYFLVFRAVRTLFIEVDELTFKTLEATLRTDLTIQNPSQVSFEILYVQERLQVGQTFIRSTGVYMQNHPLKLPPNGNLTIPIESDVSTKISEVTARLKNKWSVQITARLRGLLVGEFFHRGWFVTTITES
jgi:hypothetical protein